MFLRRLADSLVMALVGVGLSLCGSVSWYAGILGSFAVLGLASFAFVLSAMAACFAVRDLRRPSLRWQAVLALALCCLVYALYSTLFSARW